MASIFAGQDPQIPTVHNFAPSPKLQSMRAEGYAKYDNEPGRIAAALRLSSISGASEAIRVGQVHSYQLEEILHPEPYLRKRGGGAWA
jgi:hypothetical protein